MRDPGVAKVADAGGPRGVVELAVAVQVPRPRDDRRRPGPCPIAVKVTDSPVRGVDDEGMIAAPGGSEATVTVENAEWVRRPSSTVSVTSWLPAAAKEWVISSPSASSTPSPSKSQR